MCVTVSFRKWFQMKDTVRQLLVDETMELSEQRLRPSASSKSCTPLLEPFQAAEINRPLSGTSPEW